MTLAHESSYKIPENLSEHVFTDRGSIFESCSNWENKRHKCLS